MPPAPRQRGSFRYEREAHRELAPDVRDHWATARRRAWRAHPSQVVRCPFRQLYV